MKSKLLRCELAKEKDWKKILKRSVKTTVFILIGLSILLFTLYQIWKP